MLALLRLCCCQIRDSHPGGTGGRESLWRCAFGCRNCCSAEVLLLLYPLVSKSLVLTPPRASTPGKAVTAQSYISNGQLVPGWFPGHPQASGFGGAEYHRRSPGDSEGVCVEPHPPQSWCTCPCGERDPRGQPAFQERLQQNRKAYEQMWFLHPFCQGSAPQASAVGRGLTRAAVPMPSICT